MAPSAASKAASQARKRALAKARQAIRKAVPKTKFTGEKPSALLYLGVSMIALLKDLLDFVGIGSLPAIGFIVTACFSFLIFLLLTVFDNSGGWNKANRVVMRGLVFTLVVIFEGIFFGLNFLPLETFTVIGLYLFAKHAWKEEEKKAKKEGRPSVAQLRRERAAEVRQARAEERAAQQEAAVSPMPVISQTPPLSQPSMMTGQGMAPSQPQRTMSDMQAPQHVEAEQSQIEKVKIIGTTKDSNFEGSIIVKTEDTEGKVTGYALRKNSNGDLEGNQIGYMEDGSIGSVYQLHESDFAKLGQAGVLESYENTLLREKSTFQEIDRKLAALPANEEEYIKYIEEIRNLPPDATVHLYHGLKGDNYNGVLGIFNSKTHGIEQRSGPTLSFVPFGQFWANSLGLRYSLKRNQIAFPGEKNPNAVVRIGGEERLQDVGYIEDESGEPSSLPLTQFEGEMMYSKGAKIDKDAEAKINEKLQHFAEVRADLNDINDNVAVEHKTKLKDLLSKAKEVELFQFGSSLEKLTRKGFSPLKLSDQQLMGEGVYGGQADDFIREADSRLQQLSDSIEQYKKEGSQDEYYIRKYEDEKEALAQLKDEISSGAALVRQSLEERGQKHNSRKQEMHEEAQGIINDL